MCAPWKQRAVRNLTEQTVWTRGGHVLHCAVCVDDKVLWVGPVSRPLVKLIGFAHHIKAQTCSITGGGHRGEVALFVASLRPTEEAAVAVYMLLILWGRRVRVVFPLTAPRAQLSEGEGTSPWQQRSTIKRHEAPGGRLASKPVMSTSTQRKVSSAL